MINRYLFTQHAKNSGTMLNRLRQAGLAYAHTDDNYIVSWEPSTLGREMLKKV